MEFFKFKPSPYLEHLITYYWVLKSSKTDLTTATYRFVPDGYVDWVFHLGTPWQCYFPDEICSSKTSRFHVFGQIKNYVDLKIPKNGLHLFGVKFNPWVAKEIWNIDMHYLTDNCLAIEDLDLPEIKTLQERIIGANDLESRIAIIESYLSPYTNIQEDYSLKQALFSYSNDNNHQTDRSNGFGLRRLEQRFKSEIGISPKLFCRTQRINKVIEEITSVKKQSLTQLALKNNYYDQSHFIRDFKQFTGLSPSKFLKSINPDGDILNLRIN